jgi:hypothetical protein
VGYDKVRGKPFRIAEIVEEARRLLGLGGPGGEAFAGGHGSNATQGGD